MVVAPSCRLFKLLRVLEKKRKRVEQIYQWVQLLTFDSLWWENDQISKFWSKDIICMIFTSLFESSFASICDNTVFTTGAEFPWRRRKLRVGRQVSSWWHKPDWATAEITPAYPVTQILLVWWSTYWMVSGFYI